MATSRSWRTGRGRAPAAPKPAAAPVRPPGLSDDAWAQIVAANERAAAAVGQAPRDPNAKPKRKTSRLGRAFETRLDTVHRGYLVLGAASIVRQNVPTTFRAGTLTLSGKAVVDYMGALGPGADAIAGMPGLARLAVAFEAKSSTTGEFEIGDDDVFPEHQLRFLQTWPGIGFFAFVAGKIERADALILRPGPVIAARRARVKVWREADVVAAGAVRCRGADWLRSLGDLLRSGP